MKKYKNIYFSLVSYGVAAGILILWTSIVPTSPESPNWIGLVLFVLSIVVGILFGFISNSKKESSWVGNLMVLIGGLILISPIILFYIGARM